MIEKARTLTVGTVLTPTFLPRFALSDHPWLIKAPPAQIPST